MRTILLVDPAGETTLREQLESLGYEVKAMTGKGNVDAAVVPVDAILALDIPAVAVGHYASLVAAQAREDISYLVELPGTEESLGRALQILLEPNGAQRMNGVQFREQDNPEGYARMRLAPCGLSERETETVLLRAALRLNTEETAARMGIEPKTVKIHMTAAYRKVGVKRPTIAKLRSWLFGDGPGPLGLPAKLGERITMTQNLRPVGRGETAGQSKRRAR